MCVWVGVGVCVCGCGCVCVCVSVGVCVCVCVWNMIAWQMILDLYIKCQNIKNTKIIFLPIKPHRTLPLTHDNMDNKKNAIRNISVSPDVRELTCILLGPAGSYMSLNV